MPKLKQTEISTLEEAFDTGQGAGYVLDFTDRTFAMYFDEEFQIDIDRGKYKSKGTSKGKGCMNSLLWSLAVWLPVCSGLSGIRAAIIERRGIVDNQNLSDRYFQIVHKLEGDAGTASTDAIERFSNNETLDKLVAAIQRDIGANKPQAALDRLPSRH